MLDGRFRWRFAPERSVKPCGVSGRCLDRGMPVQNEGSASATPPVQGNLVPKPPGPLVICQGFRLQKARRIVRTNCPSVPHIDQQGRQKRCQVCSNNNNKLDAMHVVSPATVRTVIPGVSKSGSRPTGYSSVNAKFCLHRMPSIHLSLETD